MPRKPISSDLLLEAVKAFQQYGSKKTAAEALGIQYDTFVTRCNRGIDRGFLLSEGAASAVRSAKLNPQEAKAGWIVQVDPETKSRISTYWRAPEVDADDIIDLYKNAFDDVKKCDPILAPDVVNKDLLTVYPIMDAHYGMMAWGEETADQDYDTNIATQDMRHAFAKVCALTPNSAHAVLLVGGDFFHADDSKAETPKSKNKLDVDGRQWRIISSGIAILANIIDTLRSKHQSVQIRVLRGNHDEHSHLILTFSLAERYRDDVRVDVEKNPHDLYMRQWGKCLISAHHGDKAKPDRLTMYLSDVCPYWSETRHRYMMTGHIHHDAAKDIGPLRWESLRAFCPPDAYAAGMGYASRRALQAMTFHMIDGLVLRAIDPIER